MTSKSHPLRLNVGFFLQQSVGYRRVFPFDYEEIRFGADLILQRLTGQAAISRTPQGLLVQVHLQGTLPADCVRCLTNFSLNIETDFAELFAFDSRNSEEAEFILPEDGILDLEPLAREFLLIELPIGPVCKEDCQGLCPVCGTKLSEGDHDHEDVSIDPRLEILKKLVDDTGE